MESKKSINSFEMEKKNRLLDYLLENCFFTDVLITFRQNKCF